MEAIYWIDSAGFSQHCTEAYPNCNSDDREIFTIRNNKKYKQIIDEAPREFNFDYFEKLKNESFKSLPLPIRIPDYEMHLENGKHLISYHIYMAGYKITSRLDGEFKNLYSQILTEFLPYSEKLPKFPTIAGIRFEQLSAIQLETRRKQLEQYLYDLCRIKMIAESDLVQDFLSDSEDASLSDSIVDIRVKLPDKIVVNVSVKKSTSSEQVWKVLVRKARLSKFTQDCFYLFENVERNFDRKLQPDEMPYFIYIQNYSNALDTCLIVRRWLFSVEKELFMANSEQALSFIYHQEINDSSRQTEAKNRDLCSGISKGNSINPIEYLKLIRTDPNYGYIEFPHCSSDISKSVCVIPSVGFMSFRLRPCPVDSAYKMDCIEFMWDHMVNWKCDKSLNAFCFQIFEDQNQPGKWIKLFTRHYAYLAECFEKVMNERHSNANDPFM